MFALAYGRRPDYPEHFGLWLNRSRVADRLTWAHLLALLFADGTFAPTIAFFRSVSDGEGEAAANKARFDAARHMRNG
jgi:hypothetical protein